MLLKEFPDLNWLKHQAQTRFENRKTWDGRPLPQPGWPNVILPVKTREVYRDNIQGPFSLFGNLSGISRVKVGNRKTEIDADSFFITNAGQEYTLEVDAKVLTETFNIHFGDSFSDQVIQSLQAPEYLLENSYLKPVTPFIFHNRLIRKTPAMLSLIRGLHHPSGPMEEAEKLVELFKIIYHDENRLNNVCRALPPVKRSTREEILKRILTSVDYIYTYYNRPIDLEVLAQTSCLSKFHFLRLFKIAMGETPHQFITRVRIQKAKDLLMNLQTDVNVIAQLVGFTNASSFSRLFYHQTGTYPTQFRSLAGIS